MKTLNSIIEDNLKLKIELGSTSGTVTARLHEDLNSYVCNILWNKCFQKSQWCIAPANEFVVTDAWGQNFSLDNTIFIKKSDETGASGILNKAEVNSIQETLGEPSLSILVKHHTSSYNKNRFNNGCHEIGEVARTVVTSTGEKCRRPLLLITFIPDIMPSPTKSKGKSVWRFECPSPLPNKPVIDALFNNDVSKVVKSEFVYTMKGFDPSTITTEENYNRWVMSNRGFVEIKRHEEEALQRELLAFAPPEFLQGGSLGKNFK